MKIRSPKINLLYFKNILDNSFRMFFNENNDFFTVENDLYVFSRKISRDALKKSFREYIISEIKKYVSDFNISSPEYFFIIGSCYPSKNILIEYLNEYSSYFPEKLMKYIKSGNCVKYVLKEHDICIDIDMFNEIFESIFTEMFDYHTLRKLIGNKNVFFIKNDRLDCYITFKLIKNIFGKNNTVNLFKTLQMDNNICIYSINECIDKYINKKQEFLSSNKLDFYRHEIEQYIKTCMNITIRG